MQKKEKVYFQDLIIDKIEAILQNVFENPDIILNRSDGEDTVCLVCDLETKVCEFIPDYRCKDALKGNTEINELEKALERIKNGTFGECLACSTPFDIDYLKKNLTILYCNDCTPKAK